MAAHTYRTAFFALLDTLNAEQRRAVEQIEGPVMVIAGPGTGKTHLMAARVGKILLETDTPPQSILCLTFTDAAVGALRMRLLQMIGPEAYRVPISTFHGFCHRIIWENPEYFDFAELEPVSEWERIEIVRRLLADLPPEHPLRRGYKNAFVFEKRLRNLFSLMKRENWTPGWIHRCADKFLRELPTHPAYIYRRNTAIARKGEPKTAQVAEAKERMERLKAAADLYPNYLRALEQAHRYEFEDMVLWVLRAFEKHEALLRTYQERYLYVQVDEFQDTNGAQYDLLHRLLAYWDAPNIFIVGDDDQSIYEFQGARLEHLRDFQQRYHRDLTTVVLRHNYRSTQIILDTAARLISYNTLRARQMDDKPFDKHLKATVLGSSEVVVYAYDTRLSEIADVADRIQRLLEEGVSPTEVAVIYAQHRQADALQELLARRNIPHQAKRPVDILNMPLIEQLRELLHYLADEAERPHRGEHRLFRLLHAPFWRLHPADLATIAAAFRIYTEGGQSLPWRNLLTSEEFLSHLPLRHAKAFEYIRRHLDHWIAAVHCEPLPQLLERLYAQTGLLTWANEQPDRWTALQALKTFLDFAVAETLRRREASPADRTPHAALRHFLQTLQGMTDNRLSLPLQRYVQGGPAVQLLTAHAAKGLEFEHVFLIDCVEDFWEKKSPVQRDYFPLPPDLQPSAEVDTLEAQRRLFYVAITRAKRTLHLSYAQKGEDGTPRLPSQFIGEAGLPIRLREVTANAQLNGLTQLLGGPNHSYVPLPEASLWKSLLAHFQLTISALNRYLRCPRAFYFEDLLKIPSAPSEASVYGQAMHRALQRFTSHLKQDDKASASALLQFFEAEMERRKDLFSPANFQQRMAIGRQRLAHFWERNLSTRPKNALAEVQIDRAHCEGVPLAGIIDRIEWVEKGAIAVIDFKTGTPYLQKTQPPSDKQPYGGEYWLQMAFYRVLLDNVRLFAEPVRYAFVQWLEPDDKGQFLCVPIELSAQDLLFAKKLITDTWENIQATRFEPGCQKADCPWCQLARQQDTTLEPIHREEDTLLDDAL